MKYKILIGLGLISLLLLTGCTSSYQDCIKDCINYKYDCSFSRIWDDNLNEDCIDNLTFEEAKILCYEECRGS